MIAVIEDRHAPGLATLLLWGPSWAGHSRPIDVMEPWTQPPAGRDEHRWIRAPHLDAAARLSLGPRTRNRHTAELRLVAAPHDAAEDLLRHAVAFADLWTPVDRLELALPAGHDAIDAALEHGFEVEVRRVARLTDGRDELVLGRLRPGFTPRVGAGPPPWPARGRASPTWAFRDITEGDHEAVRTLSVEPTSVWGTLQTPSSTSAFYAARFAGSSSEDVVQAATADGAFAGIGGLHPTPVADVRVLGMAIGARWQGCGGGRALIAHLTDLASALGARRVELSVWDDNHRARALYASAGFVEEGTRRFDGWRAGGHASSLDMALTRAHAASSEDPDPAKRPQLVITP